ncbi:MAG: sensor histidine kinase [Gammaproteobacteria bacterium]
MNTKVQIRDRADASASTVAERSPWQGATQHRWGRVLGVVDRSLRRARHFSRALCKHQAQRKSQARRKPPFAAERLRAPATRRSFNLVRWYAIASLCSITAFSAASGSILLKFLDNHLLERDAAVSMEFIQLIAQVDGAAEYFQQPGAGRTHERLQLFFDRVSAMPDVIRADVYAADGSVLWTSDSEVSHRADGANDELERALTGKLTYEHVNREHHDKAEHAGLPAGVEVFVENYIPIRDPSNDSVLGVVELYKAPSALLRALAHGQLLIWMIAGSGAALLYVSLFWVVRRGQQVIHRQQEQLVSAEAMAAVGELSAAIAHSLRNPLASIRSSAELSRELEPDSPATRESAEDIIRETDRLNGWIEELLHFSRLGQDELQKVDLGAIAQASLNGFARSLRSRRIECHLQARQPLPQISGDELLLGHLFNSLIANSLEAMGESGVLSVQVEHLVHDRCVRVFVSDTGPGFGDEALPRALEPFASNKSNGLGFGLTMVRRIVERHGGEIDLLSRAGDRTNVTVKFPV